MDGGHIHTLTATRLREEFKGHVPRCSRCGADIRVLDTYVWYPSTAIIALGAVAGYVLICEPCLDREIRDVQWTPPDGV